MENILETLLDTICTVITDRDYDIELIVPQLETLQRLLDPDDSEAKMRCQGLFGEIMKARRFTISRDRVFRNKSNYPDDKGISKLWDLVATSPEESIESENL